MSGRRFRSMSNNEVAPAIQLKGTNFGIRVVFPVELPEELLVEKFEAISEETYVLPIGTGVVLDFQSRRCSEDLIGRILSRVIWPREINVLSWISADEETSSQLRRAGFQTADPDVTAIKKDFGTLILDHSLRSGQQVEAPGNVILIGHLNGGAEIYAGGSVSVLGKLKGLVHAGRSEANGVYILAGSFEPQQLRIGDRLCSQFESSMKWWKKPVIITSEENGLLLRDWKMETGNEIT